MVLANYFSRANRSQQIYKIIYYYLFAGYGGNVIRESVKTKAEWYVTDFNELIQVLNS